jgi:uncharacterized protein
MVDSAVLETAQKYLSQIPDDLGVSKAFIFGSYAKGQQREESDIDIAVVIKNMPDFFEAQMLLMRLRRNIDLRIEPHPIKEEDFTIRNPFAFEILHNGIELTIH